MFFKNQFYYSAGLAFLTLAKVKNIIQGYSSPKPFDISDIDKCIDYDIDVANHWLSHLQKYSANDRLLTGASVLELGPGSDIGVGIYLLSLGCAQYNAFDVNDLANAVPERFYDRLVDRIEGISGDANIGFLKEQVDNARSEKNSALNYVVRPDFDLSSAFENDSIDLVFSQAAFEHFDDIEMTISQLSSVCKPGAVFVGEIDLKTHSRWIRDKDPNNIYRYGSRIYNAFRFRGSPNRVRPFRYQEALERFGWTDISITPLSTIDGDNHSYSGLNRAFVDELNQMEYLTIMLCARKK